jgi:hypothetical protein
VKDVKNNETNNTTGQAANAAIRAAMHRNGGEFPVDVEDKTSPKADTKGRGKKSHGYVAPSKVHQDAADTVSSMMRAKNVTPEPNAPISADGDDVVDASGRDYREVVELRPETVPRTAAGKPSRYAKRKRGESPGSYRGATDMSEYHTRKGKGKGKGKKDDTKSDKPEWTEYQTQCHALRRDGKQCGNKSRKGSISATSSNTSLRKLVFPTTRMTPRTQPTTTTKRMLKSTPGPCPKRSESLSCGFGVTFTPRSHGWSSGCSPLQCPPRARLEAPSSRRIT